MLSGVHGSIRVCTTVGHDPGAKGQRTQDTVAAKVGNPESTPHQRDSAKG